MTWFDPDTETLVYPKRTSTLPQLPDLFVGQVTPATFIECLSVIDRKLVSAVPQQDKKPASAELTATIHLLVLQKYVTVSQSGAIEWTPMGQAFMRGVRHLGSSYKGDIYCFVHLTF